MKKREGHQDSGTIHQKVELWEQSFQTVTWYKMPQDSMKVKTISTATVYVQHLTSWKIINRLDCNYYKIFTNQGTYKREQWAVDGKRVVTKSNERSSKDGDTIVAVPGVADI